MMRSAQQSGSYTEFMSEAQRFLASDDEESVSSGEETDEPPSLRPRIYSDRRGSELAARRHEMKDRAWATAFAVNIVITLLSALHFRGTAFMALSHILESRGWSFASSGSEGARVLVVCLLVVPLAHAASSSMVNALANRSTQIIQITFTVFTMASLTVACLLWSFGAARGATVLAVVCSAIAHFLFSRRGRINFTAANLKVAAAVVKATPQISSWALFVIGVRLVWLAVISAAALGSVVASQTVHASNGTTYRAVDCRSGPPQMASAWSCECDGNIISEDVGCNYSDPNLVLVWLWLLSAIWGSAVTAQVVAAALAESVASWWSSPGRVEPVWKSSHRVVPSALGSLCKEAVVVAFFQPVNFAVILLSHAVRGVRCPLVCMRYVGGYVLDHIVYWGSIYRVDCSEATRRFGTLFSTHGLAHFHTEALVVVSVGGTLLSLALLTVVFVGIASQGASSLALTALRDPSLAIVYGASVVTVFTTIEVVMCAFQEVFACFVQDPEAFAANHDHWLQGGMYRSWQQLQLLPSTTGEAHGGSHA